MSTAGRILSWFQKPIGKKLLGFSVCFSAIGSSTIILGCNTSFLNYYKDLVHLYRHGFEVKMPPDLKKRFDEVVEDMNLTDFERKNLEPFMVSGFETFHAGSCRLRGGGVVGIPPNFTYENTKTIDKTALRIWGEPVKWSNPISDAFLNSFILSENAQKYAIAREIATLRTDWVYAMSLIPLGAIMFFYSVAFYINRHLNLFDRPMSWRITLYAILGVVCISVILIIKDLMVIHYEKYADEQVSRLGEKYIKGGEEFNSQKLKRNKCMRDLSESKGEKYFTVSGNENYLIRQKHVSTIDRLNFFKKKLSGLEGTKDEGDYQNTTDLQ